MRNKIDYGIDLGTTNSAISRMDAGEAVIIKSDLNQMDTTPSVIFFDRNKRMTVGAQAKNALNKEALGNYKKQKSENINGFQEFKRTMGTDHHYYSTNMEESFSSEALSAEVLKALKGFVRDENPLSAVITVPAMFKQSQLDATQRAANLAGFSYCELIQEPIAASIAYGIKANEMDGYWLVFDFGGGTFDAALMKVEDKIMKVVDTEGDNYLGGKNIDNVIVDQLFLPKFDQELDISDILEDQERKKMFQEALKFYAEQAKITLSSKESWSQYIDDIGEHHGEDIEFDIQISLREYENVVKPIFQKAIDIVQDLLKRNHLSGQDLKTIILIGGPTYSQTLRRMLKDQVSQNVDFSIDPMTAVARGAALYASTRSIPEELIVKDLQKVQLKLKYPETTTEKEANVGIKIERDHAVNSLPNLFFIEFLRGDQVWSSPKTAIEEVEMVSLALNEGKVNQFQIKLTDEQGNYYPTQPEQISIISGLKIASATLPYSIGIEIYNVKENKEGVYPIKGLEKNRALPASGSDRLKTSQAIRPGNAEDKIEISIYEINSENIGSKASLNNFFGKLVISGVDVPSLLPANSDVELSLKIDESRRGTLSVYIPDFDESFDIEIQSEIESDIDEVELEGEIEQLKDLCDENLHHEMRSQLDEIEQNLIERGDDRDTKHQTAARLQKIKSDLHKQKDSGEWSKLDREMNRVFEELKLKNQDNNMIISADEIESLNQEKNYVISRQDVDLATKFNKKVQDMIVKIMLETVEFWTSMWFELNRDFDSINWIDRTKARTILNLVGVDISNHPTVQKIKEPLIAVFRLIKQDSNDRSGNNATSSLNSALLRR